MASLWHRRDREHRTVRRRRLLIAERLDERTLFAAIGGLVYHDLNNSLRQDPTDTVLQDRLVYIDVNNNGELDTGEAWDRTDASGAFDFDALAAGTYQVRLFAGSQTQFQSTPRTAGPSARRWMSQACHHQPY